MGAKSETMYKRLPGKKKNLVVGYYTLYQGPDHLLMIFSRFGYEDYKRFYYTDIQAISTRKTTTAMIQNIIMAAMGLLFGLNLMSDNEVNVTIGAIMAGLFCILLFINIMRGPTSETFIQTAVQTEKLHSLHRLRTALKVMGRIRPLVINSQGQLTSNTFGSTPVRAESVKRPSRTSDQSASETGGKHTKFKNGYAHLTVFGLFILDMVVVLINTTLHLGVLSLISTIITLVIGVCVIVALVKQQASRLPKPIRLLTWAALGYLCVSWVVGYFCGVALMFKNPQIMGNQWKMIEFFASFSFFETPLVGVIHAMTIGSAIGIGLPGLLLLNQYLKSGKKRIAPAVRPKAEAPAEY